MHVAERLRARRHADGGFTLIELVVTIAIIGFIVAALTGVVMMYMKATVSTSARLTESHDVQFAAAYWQRDVSSIGVRSTVYDNSVGGTHTYPLTKSVAAPDTTSPKLAGCTLPSGTPIITLAWNSYTAAADVPTKVTVTYVAQASGSVYQLRRVRCTGTATSPDSSLIVARNLTAAILAPSAVSCKNASGTPLGSCAGSGAAVPAIVTLTLVSTDLDNNDGSTYTATLTGERRQT